jgi:hypothetical protein
MSAARRIQHTSHQGSIMTKTVTVYNAAEQAYLYALAAARRAIRGGDIALAERWIKLSDHHWRCVERAHRSFEGRLTSERDRRLREQAQSKASR